MKQMEKFDLKIKELQRKKRELAKKEAMKSREKFSKTCYRVSPEVIDSLFDLVGKTVVVTTKDGKEYEKKIERKKLSKLIEYALKKFIRDIKIIS